MAKYEFTSEFMAAKTAEELKAAYRKACKRWHPDNGGNAEVFKQVQEMYARRWERVKDVHVNKDGETYTKETTETAAEFMSIINELVKMPGVDIELCGSWIWCTGNTKPHRAKFRELKFGWSSNKCAWYFHREPYRKRGRRRLSLDEIRGLYGSERIQRDAPDALPA